MRTAMAAVRLNFDGNATPLDVMVGNMRFWWGEVGRLQEMLAGQGPDAFVMNEDDPASRRRGLALLRRYVEARKYSQECAIDAAPYMHRRLASLTVEPPGADPLEIEMAMPKQLSPVEDRSYRNAPSRKQMH